MSQSTGQLKPNPSGELRRVVDLVEIAGRLAGVSVAGETSFLTSELVQQDTHGWTYFLAGSPSELDPILERLEAAGAVKDIVYSVLGL